MSSKSAVRPSVEFVSTDEEQEADGVLIMRKRMKLRSAQGHMFPAEVLVYEVSSR